MYNNLKNKGNMSLTTLILIIVALLLTALATHLLQSNTKLLKDNTELRQKQLEGDRDVLKFRNHAKVIDADLFDYTMLNCELDKHQADGWRFGGINGHYIILFKSVKIEDDGND
jgi:hypothetical protein